MRRLFALVPALLLICLTAQADEKSDGWKQVNKQDGITVSSKSVEGSDIVAFRGEVVLESTVEKVLWILVDNDHRKEWVDRLDKSTVLERVHAHEYVIYQAFKLPWFLSNRDYVYRGVAKRDAKTGVVTLDLASCTHSKGPKTVGVRASLKGSYILTPMEKGKKVKVEVEIHTDPKGMIPTWLVNLIQKSWPLKTLNGIRKQTKKDYVTDYPLPPVKAEAPKVTAKKPAIKKPEKAPVKRRP